MNWLNELQVLSELDQRPEHNGNLNCLWRIKTLFPGVPCPRAPTGPKTDCKIRVKTRYFRQRLWRFVL